MITKEQLSKVRLVALDLDGTFLNEKSIVSDRNKEAVRRADSAGIKVALSTGRPLCGVLPEYLENVPIRFAVTTNGAGIYDLDSKTSIFDQCMDYKKVAHLTDYLITKHIHFDVFIEGDGYSDERMVPVIEELDMPPELKYYLHGTRKTVPDICAYLRAAKRPIQKVTMNFPPNVYKTDRVEVQNFLQADPSLRLVSGGYMNLEITDISVSKAKALSILGSHLGLQKEEIMAIGDSGNDLDMIKAAGIGVAMGNAVDEVKAAADLVIEDNIHDGVALMLDELTELSAH